MAMRRLELQEYEQYREDVTLEKAHIAALKDHAHVDVTPSTDEENKYKLTPSSYVGALNIGDLAVIIRPKIPIDRVLFLIAYAMDPKNWRRETVGLASDDVLEAIAMAFAHRTRQAIRRGLLQGYRREEDALYTVRGRIRFGDQISRRFGIPLPVELAFDEYTEDIEKNRLLKTAIHRLGHTLIHSPTTRRELRRLRPALESVRLGSYRRGALPEVAYSRLDEHYRPAVELARLIIENSSLELFHGKVASAALLIDMNKVFEEFLYVALGEALGLPERQWRHEEGLTLDEAGRIPMKPDLSWWPSGTMGDESQPIFVGDAKYKWLEPRKVHSGDVYQMLAYCTAANLPSGLLVYAGKGESSAYKIKHAGKTIEIASLDLTGTPDAILDEVGRLADRINACRPSGARVPDLTPAGRADPLHILVNLRG